MNNGLHDLISDALKGHDARYIEIRIDESDNTYLRYHGRELEEVSRTTGGGGCVRALADGGWGFVSFNNLDHLKDKVAAAIRNARLVGGEPVAISPVEPWQDTVRPQVNNPPSLVSLDDKKALMDQYVEEIWTVPGISTSTVGYSDARRHRIFATSEGAYIDQERLDISLRLNAVARDGGDVQQSGVSLGSAGDYSEIEGLHETARGVALRAVELLKAPQVKGGEYTVVLEPILAGVFIHEAFGHLSEADHIYEDQKMKEIMVLGRRFGGGHLNVIDGAAVPNLRGSYAYDDEGVPSTSTYLLKEGVLVGRLHSRETAAKMEETITGNARAIGPQFPPIVRMTNTFIEAGEPTAEEIIADIKDGLYVSNWYGGMTSMEQFTFSAGEAHVIRNGRIEELHRPVLLTGNLFTTLESLDAVANDLRMNQGGGCGKGGQSPLPVSNGSPHIRIQRCLIGGS
jgi:TldD protein